MAAKASRQLPAFHSLNMASADFFIFWKVKPELAGLLLSLGNLKKSLEGSSKLSAKRSLLPPYSSGWTAAKSMSESALARPKKKSQNKRGFKMIHIEVISSCAVDFNYTS
jgi:hypothetical protein